MNFFTFWNYFRKLRWKIFKMFSWDFKEKYLEKSEYFRNIRAGTLSCYSCNVKFFSL